MRNFLSLRKLIFVIGMAICWNLVSCSSSVVPTTRFYFIEPTVDYKNISGSPAKYPVVVTLKMPAAISPYDTNNLIVKVRPAEITFYNYEKWVAAPHEMIYNSIMNTLTYSRLVEMAPRKGVKTSLYVLDFQVREFAQAKVNAKAVGSLTIVFQLAQENSNAYDWIKEYHLEIPAQSDDPYAIVVALNEGIAELNRLLLNDLNEFFSKKLNL